MGERCRSRKATKNIPTSRNTLTVEGAAQSMPQKARSLWWQTGVAAAHNLPTILPPCHHILLHPHQGNHSGRCASPSLSNTALVPFHRILIFGRRAIVHLTQAGPGSNWRRANGCQASGMTPVVDLTHGRGAVQYGSGVRLTRIFCRPAISMPPRGRTLSGSSGAGGRYREAWEDTGRDNPMPAVHGRSATTLAKAAATAESSTPRQIDAVRRFLGDLAVGEAGG